MDRRRAEEIRRAAGSLLRELDRDSPPGNRIDRIDPFRLASEVLRLSLEEPEEIPLQGGEGDLGHLPFRVGSILDRRSSTVTVARRLTVVARRYTLAHTLGHGCLHTRSTYFRDAPRVAGERPALKLTSETQVQEEEANRFAEELLMPAELLRSYFRDFFRVPSLRDRGADASLAAWLSFGTERRITVGELMENGRDYIALLVAQCIPAGQPSYSLARRFKVSPLAMSQRLLRLGLV